MNKIINTEILDLPTDYSLELGTDVRGFDVILNMTIRKRTTDYYNKLNKPLDIYLNRHDWYYQVDFELHSKIATEIYDKFDVSTPRGRRHMKLGSTK